MKTTLTLEDVERLEKWETFHDANWAPIDRGTLRGLLSLAKERLQGNPEGLLLPQGASPPVHSDVQPVWVEMAGDRWCPECGKSGPHWHTNPIPSPSDASLPSSLSGGAEQVKSSQEGSMCEVGPLGEVEGGVLTFNDEDDVLSLVPWEGREWFTARILGTVALNRKQTLSLISHLQAWVETGSFRLVPRGGAADQP